MTKLELERALEQRCVAKVEARGGLALKLAPAGTRGFPDRTILMPHYVPGKWTDTVKPGYPRVWFAEFKRLKTGKVSAQQHRWRVLLHQLGFGVHFIDTDEQFDEILRKETYR